MLRGRMGARAATVRSHRMAAHRGASHRPSTHLVGGAQEETRQGASEEEDHLAEAVAGPGIPEIQETAGPMGVTVGETLMAIQTRAAAALVRATAHGGPPTL